MTEGFDRYKVSYKDKVQESIGFIGQDVDFFTRVKADQLVDLATRQLGDPKALKVLDVGCGIGLTDACLGDAFGELYGVDMSPGVVQSTAEANPLVKYLTYDGSHLPFEDDAFDISFAICVLHHVPPESWSLFVTEMARVTKGGGLVAIFEHNPFNPLTLLAVNRCEFDKDAVLLKKAKTRRLLQNAGLTYAEGRYILFFPWRARVLRRLEEILRPVPLGAQYFVTSRKLKRIADGS